MTIPSCGRLAHAVHGRRKAVSFSRTRRGPHLRGDSRALLKRKRSPSKALMPAKMYL